MLGFSRSGSQRRSLQILGAGSSPREQVLGVVGPGLVLCGGWGDREAHDLEVALGWVGLEIDPALGAGKVGRRPCPAHGGLWQGLEGCRGSGT